MGKDKLKDFGIKFDHPDAVFKAGDILSGKVFVNCDKPMSMRSIKLQLVGMAKIRPIAVTGKKVEKMEEETYFDETVTLYPEENKQPAAPEETRTTKDKAITLEEGAHDFTFRLRLPEECPTSIEGKRGYVRYWSKAWIDKPWKLDKVAKRAFTVIGEADLDKIPEAKNPVRAHIQKSTGNCCASGEVTVDMSMPRTGYTAGENIPVTLFIENGTNKAIDRYSIHLQKEVVAVADVDNKHKKKEDEDIVEVSTVHVKRRIEPHANNTDTIDLGVPAVPSGMVSSKLLRVNYKVLTQIGFEKQKKTMDVQAGVIIGTSPMSDQYNPADPPDDVNDSIHPSRFDEMERGEYQTKSPLYSLSGAGNNIKEDDEKDHEWGEKQFMPKYPVYYNWRNVKRRTPATDSKYSGFSNGNDQDDPNRRVTTTRSSYTTRGENGEESTTTTTTTRESTVISIKLDQ